MEHTKNNEKKLTKILGKITGQTKLKELQKLKDEGTLTEKEFKKLKSKLFIKICTIEVILIILIPMIVVGAIGIKQEIDNKRKIAAEEARLAAQVEVPNVKGMTIDKATETLSNIGLNIKLTDYAKKLTGEKPNEYVVDTQYPSANEKVDRNTEVSLFFKETMTIEANNTFGRCFKITKEELSQKFLGKYDKSLINMGFIDNKFSYQESQNGAKLYGLSLYKSASTATGTSKEPYFILIALEEDDKLIKVMGVIADFDKQNAKLQQSSLNAVYNMYYSLGINNAESMAMDLLQKGENKEKPLIYKDNILYQAESYNSYGHSYIRFSASAITEEKLNELSTNTTNNNSTNDNTSSNVSSTSNSNVKKRNI